jgi:hypothetical protein
MFGKGISDVMLLKELGTIWKEKGGSFVLVYGHDLGKTGLDAEKMVGCIWIAPYAHLLVEPYGDLFCTDGTHGMSQYGWRAMPFCTANSLDNPHPLFVVFATSENADVMCLAVQHLYAHLVEQGVDFPQFAKECEADEVELEEEEDDLPEQYICPSEWRTFIQKALEKLENNAGVELPPMPTPDSRPTLLVDGGTGLDLLGRRYCMGKVECKTHLDSHNHIPAGPLK